MSRVWVVAAIVLTAYASPGTAPGLAQEKKSSLGALLPAIINSLGNKAADPAGPLKKTLEGAGTSNTSTFNAPAFPASPGGTGTIAPTSPTPPRVENPKARAIQTAQGHLTKLGYNAGPVDGKMRPRTRKAIRGFQTSRGLQATGRVSAALLKELGKSVEQARAEHASASTSNNNSEAANRTSAGCVIPKPFRDTLKGVQPIGAGSFRGIKPGRYRVTAKQALGTAGRKHYVRPGDIVDVQFGAKKAGWRIGGPIVCQDGVAIGVAYRGKGFFAGNGKKRVFVLLPKRRS